jgi:hypothetical protein
VVVRLNRALAIFFLALAMSSLSWGRPVAQQDASQPGQRNSNPTQPIAPAEPGTDDRSRVEREMAKKANEERQAHLKRDTERLVKLANELKSYVDKSNENVLSMDVVKKADEIEKLAHSVKEKMKGNY